MGSVTAELSAITYIHPGHSGAHFASPWLPRRGEAALVLSMERRVKHSLAIALAISLFLGAAAAWGSCAVPRSDKALAPAAERGSEA